MDQTFVYLGYRFRTRAKYIKGSCYVYLEVKCGKTKIFDRYIGPANPLDGRTRAGRKAAGKG
jgi:hypothetical protein